MKLIPVPEKAKHDLVYDYHDIHDMVQKSSRNLSNYDVIVAVARGGLIPATILSHIIKTPVYSVTYSATGGNGDNKISSTFINPLQGIDIPSNRILLVDDIVDSGHTLKELSEEFEADGYIVTTFVLDWRNGRSCHVPNYYCRLIDEDINWVIYPWEQVST